MRSLFAPLCRRTRPMRPTRGRSGGRCSSRGCARWLPRQKIQQAMLSLHRMRALLVKFRTMQVNQLRGLLYEFGATFRAGRLGGLAEIRARMAELEAALPGTMIGSLQDQLRRI